MRLFLTQGFTMILSLRMRSYEISFGSELLVRPELVTMRNTGAAGSTEQQECLRIAERHAVGGASNVCRKPRIDSPSG